MLQELSIKNFAVIKDIAIHFEDGMTVLTGETGAGKSIIIDAVGLLTGGRGSSQFVRYGEDKSQLQALFFVEKNQEKVQKLLQNHDIPYEDQSLLIQRDLYENGRQVSRVNGSLVTVGILKDLGRLLVDIQGQHDQQDLMRSDQHIHLLDRFGNSDFQRAKSDYYEAHQAFTQLKKDYDQWQDNEQEANQLLDMLNFQIQELEEAELTPGEDQDLEEERGQLLNFQNIVEALSTAYQLLQGEDGYSSLEAVRQASDSLQSVSEYSDSYQSLEEQVTEAYFQLDDAASSLSGVINNLEFDGHRLNEIEGRLALIQQLKKKYGQTIPEIMDFYEEAKRSQNQLLDRETSIDGLRDQLQIQSQIVMERGQALSQMRRQLAGQLQEAVLRELKDLYMEKTKFMVHFHKDLDDLSLSDRNEEGLDRIEFCVSTNPGEPFKSLADTASGGELSRMMLALKTVFTQQQAVETTVMDEVDTGVSGRVAQAIADKMYSIAGGNQLLCITHLPQVAAQADYHLYISKQVEDGRTSTQVAYLEEKEITRELAQMLAGDDLSQASLEAAQELRKHRLN